MFMEVGDEVTARREALMASVDAALKAGLLSDAKTRLRIFLLESMFDGFRQSLPGDLPARVEPFQVVGETKDVHVVRLRADADLSLTVSADVQGLFEMTKHQGEYEIQDILNICKGSLKAGDYKVQVVGSGRGSV